MTSRPLAVLSVTVKVSVAVDPSAPSATLGASTDSSGVASSSVIVPLAVPAPWSLESVALVSVPRVTSTVSLSSSNVSPFTLMTMAALVSPAEMVMALVCGSS